MQWNGVEPGVLGAVNVALPLPGTLTSKAPPLSTVMVCDAESSLVTVIFAPGAMLAGTWYLKSLIVIDAVFVGVELSDSGDGEEGGSIDGEAFVVEDGWAEAAEPDMEAEGGDDEFSALLPDVPQAAKARSATAATPANPVLEMLMSTPPWTAVTE